MVSKFVTFFVLASTVVSAAPIELFRRAPSFAEIDISRLGGNGVEAEANAAKVCPSTLSPADLEAIRKVAEDAEKTVFNAGLSAATDTDTKKAIQCQKDRNKVLKNHCQLVKAQLQNDAAQIAENTKQLTKNRNDVTTRCANVDTKKFIGAGNATPPKTGGNAGNTGNTGNGAVAGGAVSFASIDISRKAGDGTAASNNAKAVCPSTLSPAALEAIRRVAEDAEKTVFNAALAKTTDKTAKAAIQCQKDRNKVLKNTCQLVKAQLQNDQAQIDENTKQLKKNTGDVTSRCGNVDTTKFVVGAAGFTAQAVDEADETDEAEVDSFAAESTDDESAETEEADDVAAESTDEADDETDAFAAESTEDADDETDAFAAESTEDAGDESDAFAAESTDEADETDVADDLTAEAADESEVAEDTEDAAESA